MKVVIQAHADKEGVYTEGEIDDPADCVVGNRAVVRVAPDEYKAGVIVAVDPERGGV